MRKFIGIIFVTLAIAALGSVASATTYNVGPGQTLANIGDVPWESLTAGDTVNIYYRATAYKEKFLISGIGTLTQPITVHGVPGPGGELPVIDGQNATTRLALSVGSEARGIIEMQQGDATTIPPAMRSQYIIIENLEIKNGSVPYTFTDDSGVVQSYVMNTSGIWMVDAKHVTIRNCYIHDCGNGIMTFCLDTGTVNWTEDFLIEGNFIGPNGNAGSNQEHGTYTESLDVTFQYNRYVPPRGGDTQAIGNGLKDRSAGLVVRYNWIEGGNRCLDLIDCEDSSTLGLNPHWNDTFLYGNVLIERPDIGNRQVVNFGKDMHAKARVNGYFYNNTVVSYRATATETRTTVVRNTGTGFFDVRNCILFTNAAGNLLEITNDSSKTYPINITNCWMKPGYVLAGPSGGKVNDYGGHVLGTDPGWVDYNNQDFHLAAGSACINAGTTLHANAAAYPVTLQYVKHQGHEARPSDGILDIGAFEAAGGPPAPVSITTTSLPAGSVGVAYSATLTATGGIPPYTWSLLSGSLPNGLSLSAAGVISGTPTTAGTAYFSPRVADSQQPPSTDSKALSILINAAPAGPTITTTSLPNGTWHVNYSQTVQATGGTLPYAWTRTAGALPGGLTLNASTGVISGRPSTRGTFNFTIRCTDAASQFDDQALTIIIQ